MLHTKFSSFGHVVAGKIFRNRATRKNNWLWRPCLYTDRNEM